MLVLAAAWFDGENKHMWMVVRERCQKRGCGWVYSLIIRYSTYRYWPAHTVSH